MHAHKHRLGIIGGDIDSADTKEKELYYPIKYMSNVDGYLLLDHGETSNGRRLSVWESRSAKRRNWIIGCNIKKDNFIILNKPGVRGMYRQGRMALEF